MTRWFNVAGPCQSDIHYMLPTSERLPTLASLIDQRGYFVVHAPRQTGKTTVMLTLAQQLNEQGNYAAVVVSAETGASFDDDPRAAEDAILQDWQSSRFFLPEALRPPARETDASVRSFLQAWAIACPLPIVLFIDEIDSLKDDALIYLLRQLRSGYHSRPSNFPQSVVLVGLRDVRDYKVASGGSVRLGTASPFNIKVESLTLQNFTYAEVERLYGQHTADTGQVFTLSAIQRAYELTQGQPWLVNALARQMVEFIVLDPAVELTVEHVNKAKEILIVRQDTHLDSLAERLREPRVRNIIEPMLAGQELGNVPNEDIQFLIDLGLCVMTPDAGLAIANPIYREVLPRVLAFTPMAAMPRTSPDWLSPSGNLDPDALLQAFLKFWKQHGEPLLKSAPYHEIAPHLVMMAFLHRVVNGGGTLEREYALGTGRMDLCLRYGSLVLGIELKVWRDGRPDPLIAGVEQLDSYLARLDLETGWLVIFDRRSGLPPIEERTMTESVKSQNGRLLTVVRG